MSKAVKIMFGLLTIISLAGGITVYLLLNEQEKGKEPEAEKLLEYSVDIPEITTVLKSRDYVKITFKVSTFDEESKKEFEYRSFQAKDIIIKELAETDAEKLKGRENLVAFEKKLKEQFNTLMQTGEVQKVYTTSFIIQ